MNNLLILPAKRKRARFYFYITSTLKSDDYIDYMVPLPNRSNNFRRASFTFELSSGASQHGQGNGKGLTCVFSCVHAP